MSNDPVARLDRFRSLIGRAPDSEIAEELGVTVEDVKAYRRANKINPYLRPAPGVAPQSADPGAMAPDATAPESPAAATVAHGPARDEGAPALKGPTAVAASPAAHPLEAYRDQLGIVADDVIAERAGMKSHVVGRFRRAAGITAYTGNRFLPGQLPPGAQIRRAAPAESETVAQSGTAVPAVGELSTAAALPSPVAPRKSRGTRASGVGGVSAGAVRLEEGAIGVRFTLPPSAADRRRRAGGAPVRVVRPAAPPAPATPVVAPSQPAPVATTTERKFKNGKLTAFRHLIGVESDAVVAALANATAGGVKKYRERHGIAPAPAARPVPEPAAVEARAPVAPPAPVDSPGVETPAPMSATAVRPPRPSKLDTHRDIVGVLTGAAVGAIVGVTREGVRQFRKRHGIPSALGGEPGVEAVALPPAPVLADRSPALAAAHASENGRAAPTGAPTAEPVVVEPAAAPAVPGVVPAPASALQGPPVAVSSTHRFAFRVVAEARGESRRFIVVGEHIGEAAMTAVRALGERDDGPWTVRLVKVVEEALS